jgi:uncharacterized protein (DUF58 family)
VTVPTALAAATALGTAAAAPAPVGPGLVGFLVVAAIGVALYFLVKSMNRQISKIEVPREADLAGSGAPRAAEPDEAEAGGRQTGQRADGTR